MNLITIGNVGSEIAIPKQGACGFSDWTQKGKQLEFACQID